MDEGIEKTFAELEQDIIIERLKEYKGNKRKAAKSLGIGRATLYRKLKIYYGVV